MSAPTFVPDLVFLWVVPMLMYYFGIFTRKKVMPVLGSPSLTYLFLLGVFPSLLIIAPLVAVMKISFEGMSTEGVGAASPYIFTLAVIMEHGFLVHETVVARVTNSPAQLPQTNGSSSSVVTSRTSAPHPAK